MAATDRSLERCSEGRHLPLLMGAKHRWISLTTTQRGWFEHWSQRGEGYHCLRSTDLTPLLPPSYEAKVQEAVLMVAPTSSGGTYVVVNYARLDRPAWSTDQDPLGLIVDATGARATALLIHHGTWAQRTVQPLT